MSEMKSINDALQDGTMIIIPPYVLCHSPHGQHLTEYPTIVYWGVDRCGGWAWIDKDRDIFEPHVFWSLPDMSMISKPERLN